MASSLLYISIAYCMQKGGGGLQIACTISYVLNGRPLCVILALAVAPGVLNLPGEN